jgi:hypothetical protein
MAASPRTAGHLLDQHSLATRQVDQQGVFLLRFDPPECGSDGNCHDQKKGDE